MGGVSFAPKNTHNVTVSKENQKESHIVGVARWFRQGTMFPLGLPLKQPGQF